MLRSYVKVAFYPANSLESHSCTFHTSKPLRITSLRKNRGWGGQSAISRCTFGSFSALHEALPSDDMHLGDWIHHPSGRMQQSPRLSAHVAPDTSRHSPLFAFVPVGLPHHFTIAPHQPIRICHPEQSEGSAFRWSLRTISVVPQRTPQLTHLTDFPILLVQMNSRIHRHHHHHGTAPRLMRCA